MDMLIGIGIGIYVAVVSRRVRAVWMRNPGECVAWKLYASLLSCVIGGRCSAILLALALGTTLVLTATAGYKPDTRQRDAKRAAIAAAEAEVGSLAITVEDIDKACPTNGARIDQAALNALLRKLAAVSEMTVDETKGRLSRVDAAPGRVNGGAGVGRIK